MTDSYEQVADFADRKNLDLACDAYWVVTLKDKQGNVIEQVSAEGVRAAYEKMADKLGLKAAA